MKKLLNKIISKIKGYKYSIDDNISTSDLITIVIGRIIMFLRGLHVCFFIKGKDKKIFLGKKVIIKSKHNLKILGSATIEDYCYINCLSKNGVSIGNDFKLGRNSIIECTGVIRNIGEELKIGKHVGISNNCQISVRGKIEIGDNVIIGPYTKIYSENHNFDKKTISIMFQGEKRNGVHIGNNCWIGSNVVILDGVSIGDGCVIGAGSVVTQSFPDNSVIVGVPAKKIKDRC